MPDEIAVVEAPQVIETPAVVETPAQSMDDTLAATMAKIVADRPKQGEDGKFIAKAGADGATPTLEKPGTSGIAPPDPATPVIEAPQSLPADVKAKWSALPPETQQWLANRESEIHKKITSDGERLKSLSAFDEALSPSLDFIQQNQIPKPEYVRRLAAADHALRTNPQAALAEIARMYGIAPAIGQPQGQPMDPTINALVQRTAALETHLTQQQKAAEAARLSEAEKKVEAFRKNAPHFDKVEDMMTKLYEPGMELEALYEMATKAHPEVSKLLAAEADAKAKADAAQKLKEEAAAAAKLAPFARKPGSVGVAARAGNSWEDSMQQTMRAIKARG